MYYVQRNQEAKHGYELVTIDDAGNEKIVALTRKTTDNYLHMPEECAKATNRRLISIAMIEKANVDRFEVTYREYREPRVLGPKTNDGTTKTATKDWADHLTDEEKVVYEELKAKAERRAQIAALKAQMAADQARLAKLEAQA